MSSERSFIMVKPDGVNRGLIADIIKRFEQKGFKLVAMKFMKVFYTEIISNKTVRIWVIPRVLTCSFKSFLFDVGR
jgi:nucleoside diphosphate kinase